MRRREVWSTWVSTAFFALVFWAMISSPWPGPALFAREARIHPDVLETFDRDGRAVVCVLLDEPDHADGASLDARCKGIARRQSIVESGLPSESCKTRYRFRYSSALLVEVTDRKGLAALETTANVRKVLLDTRGSGALAESRPFISVDFVNQELGLKGRGTVVAVLDSGIDTDHQDFEGRILHQFHYLNQGESVGEGAEDEHGHGTNVSGVIGSSGMRSEPGMAPESEIVVVRVLDGNNNGFVSDWAAGLEHIIDLHREDNGISIDVVNMSLATFLQYPSSCDATFVPLAIACREARELGLVLVAASGNRNSTSRMASPGCLSTVFSVGSVRDRPPERVSDFSNRNEHTHIMAPGEEILASGKGGWTSPFKGTSQATAHVSGVLALMREAAPSIDSTQATAVMSLTAAEFFDEASELTLRRIDARAALEALVRSGDCNANGISDYIDTKVDASAPDCNGNVIPDICELGSGAAEDCDESGVPDDCEIAGGTHVDGNVNGIPDRCEPRSVFFRGDPNHDGTLDISDPLYILAFLFRNTEEVSRCHETMDFNNDGVLNIADPLSGLRFLFGGGNALTDPGPPSDECGPDTDPLGSLGDFGCDEYEHCRT